MVDDRIAGLTARSGIRVGTYFVGRIRGIKLLIRSRSDPRRTL
jgi:hypothetical protein